MPEPHELVAGLADQPLQLQQQQQQEQQIQKQDNNHMDDDKSQLGRRLSAPARLKPLNENLNLKQNNTSQLASFSNKRHCRFRHSQSCHEHHHCTSTLAGSHHHRHHLHHLHHHHKSASPLSSSSSASDSAFSRSRSTLGPDSERSSNCFTNGSLKSNESHFSNEDKERDHRSSDNNLLLHNQDDHFQIIWRNLSYKVPAKRLARLAACLTQIGSTPDDLSQPREHEVINHRNCHHQVDQLEDGPPLRTPIANKQRQVIFSNLNGCVKSGQLTAILGPSGAGKTTFLKCLTNSIVKGVSGSIDVIGGSSNSHHLKLCIIPQKGECH